MTVNQTAKFLGITRATLWLRCKRHGIVPKQDPEHATQKRFSEEQLQELQRIVSGMRQHSNSSSNSNQ